MPSRHEPASDRIGGLVAGSGAGPGLDDLLPLVYDELRRLARAYLRRERRAVTLQPTALVNEAYLKLRNHRPQQLQSRTHVVAVAAVAMRQVLIEAARSRGAVKRGGGAALVTLDEGLIAGEPRTVDVLAVDAALHRLAEVDPKQAKLVELRFFGGLTIEECAEALGSSPATVKRHWAVARAWLQREISRERADGR